MLDLYGQPLPPRVWHGSSNLPETISPSAAKTSWWRPMDHDVYLDPPEEEDEDAAAELQFLLRTAYANIVYDAFLHSDDTSLRDLASAAGLDGLGDEVGILFVTGDQEYAERYGEVCEVDLEASGIIAVLPDDHLCDFRQAWILVLKAGSPFPTLNTPAPAP